MLRVKVGKSKVMRCSRYGNGGQMHVRLNGEPLEEVNCYKYLGSLVVADDQRVLSRADQRVLRWFGLLEILDEYHIARRVLMADVSGRRVRGRPRLGWMDGVKVALSGRGMVVEAARQWWKIDMKERGALVHI